MKQWVLARVVLLAIVGITPGTAGQAQTWVGTWAAAASAEPYPAGALPALTTLREIVHVSTGGRSVRVTFSNELGIDSLTVAGAHVGLIAEGSRVAPGTDHALRFGGQETIVIPRGAVAVSDPIAISVAPLANLAVTLLLPAQPLHVVTAHPLALQTNYEVAGDQLNKESLEEAKPFDQWRFLRNVEVSGAGAAIVALGDSITDGYRSTPGANKRWPDVLAERLQADKRTRELAMLNEGISGNRLLHDGAGPNALSRFDRDVLSQSGVRSLIVLEGINDIGRTDQPHGTQDAITTQQLLVALEQIIERAHAHGIRVFGATLTPFLGAGYASPAGEAMRQAVNTWIRTSGRFDGVLDLDKITRDPDHQESFLPAYDSGDHLHPNDAGYKAIGDAIDLRLFQP